MREFVSHCHPNSGDASKGIQRLPILDRRLI
jgi:hypothetical protein